MAKSEDQKNVLGRPDQPEQIVRPEPPEQPYSIFPKWQRMLYVYVASLAAFASPVSSSIYYPAMLTLARDLDTSLTHISLTITTYLVLTPHSQDFVRSKTDHLHVDFSRCLTNDRWRTVRPNWTQTSLFSLLYAVHRRQYWARLTDKLRRIAYPALCAKLR